MANRIALTIVFTLSFMSYMTAELNPSLQLAPLVLFGIIVFCKALCSDSVVGALTSLLDADGLLFVLFLAALTLASSLASNSDKSFESALIVTGVLLLARIYMAIVPLWEVMEAFFWSGIVSIELFVLFGFSSLLHSIQTLERLSPFSFHPNLLAFLAAGYFCAMAWKSFTSRGLWRVLSAFHGALCLIVIFFASSRGSIVGVACGCFLVGCMSLIRLKREKKLRVRWQYLMAAGLLLVLTFTIAQSEWVQNAYDVTDKVLAITDSHRGMDSGFTGRFEKWRATLNVLSDGSWLLGKGIRSSDAMQDNLIDNSYLVVLYEIGLVPLILITWRFFDLTKRLAIGYLRSANSNGNLFYLFCGMLLAVFLANDFVARFLFSVGNPYSLVALLFFVTPTARLVSAPNVPKVAPVPTIASYESYARP
jgi:hypothetical protein